MHIHAQTKVDQMTMWLKKQRGHDQHAAITTTITTSITTWSPRWDLDACGSGHRLGRAGRGVDCRPVARHSRTPSTPLQSPRGGPRRQPCPSRSHDGAAVTTELLDLGARPGTTSRVSCSPRQLCELQKIATPAKWQMSSCWYLQ